MAGYLESNFKDYDALLVWNPNNQCNLRCKFCIENKQYKHQGLERANKIKIKRLINILNETGMVFKFHITGGGEPMLIPNIVEACYEITKKHYISFNTNLTSKKIKDMARSIDPKGLYYIRASCHVEELKRLNLLDRFIDNYKILKDHGFNIIAYEVGFLPLLKDIKKTRRYFKDHDVELHFSPFEGYFNKKFYPISYIESELKVFDISNEDIMNIYQKGKLCNAGYNIASVQPSGNIILCNKLSKSLGNIYNKFRFNDNLIQCPFKLCRCPYKHYDHNLFKKALKESQSYASNRLYFMKDLIIENFFRIQKKYMKPNTQIHVNALLKKNLERFMKI